MVGVYLGCTQFNALELLLLPNRALDYLILVNVDNYVGFCFGIVQKELIRRASNEPGILLK